MKKLFVSLLALVAAATASANDSGYYTNGNTLFPYANTSISVDKEVLTIRLADDRNTYYDVDYTFVNNSNKSITILMGFEADPPYPETPALTNSGHPNMKNFTVNINGENIKYKTCVADLVETANKLQPLDITKWKAYEGNTIVPVTNKDDNDEGWKHYAYVYYFNATFKPGKNHIRHTFNFENGEGVMETFFTSYKLSPASRWAGGKIRDFTLRITAPNTAKHFVLSTDAAKNDPKIVTGKAKFRKVSSVDSYEGSPNITRYFQEISMRNATLEWHLTNYKPTENELHITSGESALYLFYTDAQRERLEKTPTYFYDRSESYHLWTPGDEKPNPRLIRNLPYAHRGYVFKDATLKKHFSSLWWYMPDPSYKPSQSDFLKHEWQSIQDNK